jgi:hypothetical protein
MAFDTAGMEKAITGAIQSGGGSKSSSDDDDSKTNSHSIHRSSYHRGGKVRKSGLANLKKGEVVLTKKQAQKRGQKRGRK